MREKERNPQAAQMAHESMVRNLEAQAQAIWPQERLLVERYALGPEAAILDVACGTGEISVRLAELFPTASVTGVDLHAAHLDRARERSQRFGSRVRFEIADAFALGFADRSFDLVVCRHLLQAVPEPQRVIQEMARVAKRGGYLHVVAEDYAMMHFHPTERDCDRFWLEGPVRYAAGLDTDLRSGRKMFTILLEAGLTDVRVDYVVIDPVRVPRDVFARIWIAWRDGFAEAIAAGTGMPLDEVVACFDEMIAAIQHPRGYGVWHLPVISGRVP